MELLLFALSDDLVAAAGDAGLDGLVVDLERRGKSARQAAYDTGISMQTLADVSRVRALSDLPLIVRVDGPGHGLARRLVEAAEAGADELLVPMVSNAAEVAHCLAAAPGGIPVGILVERNAAVADISAIARLAPARTYVGLTDLMIERRAASPFTALVDGTVDHIRTAVATRMGVAGLTVPGHGSPVPVELIAGELVRLGADFTFLRRSFIQDLSSPSDMESAVAAIRSMLAVAHARSRQQVAADTAALSAAVATLATA